MVRESGTRDRGKRGELRGHTESAHTKYLLNFTHNIER